jgi:hypothetical protein
MERRKTENIDFTGAFGVCVERADGAVPVTKVFRSEDVR